MSTFSKITLLSLILVAFFFAQAITPAYADSMFSHHSQVTGSKANSHLPQPKAIHHHTQTRVGPIMQDLTQCTINNLGQVVCVDVCGGLSVPGSVCSYE